MKAFALTLRSAGYHCRPATVRGEPETGQSCWQYLVILMLGLALAACGETPGGGDGGGDGGDPPVDDGSDPNASNNLAFRAVEVESSNPTIGYTLELWVTIEATEATENVGVALFAIDKDRPNPRQLPIGERTIPRVEAGNGLYYLSVEIPANVGIPGPYYIAAIVDPLNTVPETNKQDNTAHAVANLSAPPSPNIFIESMQPDRSVILLDRASYDYAAEIQNGVVNSDAGGTITYGVEGTDTAIAVEAFAVMRLLRSDSGLSYDVPLYLWNSNTNPQRYMNAYGVDPVLGYTGIVEWLPIGQIKPQLIEGNTNVVYNQTDRLSAHLDFYFPGKLTQELETALRNPNAVFPLSTFPPPDLSADDIDDLRRYLRGITLTTLSSNLCVTIRPVDSTIVDQIPFDNETCSPLAFDLPPLEEANPPAVATPYLAQWAVPVNALYYGDSASAGWAGDNFGYSIDFSASTTADKHGFIVNANGKLPVTVFGSTFDIINVEARAQAYPDIVNPLPGIDPTFGLTISSLGQVLANPRLGYGDYGKLVLSFSKEKGFEKIFFIHGIRLIAAAGVSGSIGVDYEPKFNQSDVSMNITPNIDLNVFGSGTVNLFLVEAGLEASMSLVNEAFEISAGSPVIVFNDGFVGGVSEVAYFPGLRITNVLTGANGDVSAFVGVAYPTMVRCSWGWFGEGYCPGSATARYYKELADWDAWEKRDPLIDLSRLIDVVTLQDGTVYYVSDR